MKLELEVYNCLCELSKFTINGINAQYHDFGNKYDDDSEGAEDYCCGNMIFEPKNATQDVLDRYKITINEYNDICKQLRENLSFGSCRWCS